MPKAYRDGGELFGTAGRYGAEPAVRAYRGPIPTGARATAYFLEDGSYVVRDNTTESILQVSDRNDPNWIPDSSVTDPFRRSR